jgi:hypothetical protein
VNLRYCQPLRLHLWIRRFIFPNETLFILLMQIQSAEEIIDILSPSCFRSTRFRLLLHRSPKGWGRLPDQDRRETHGEKKRRRTETLAFYARGAEVAGTAF